MDFVDKAPEEWRELLFDKVCVMQNGPNLEIVKALVGKVGKPVSKSYLMNIDGVESQYFNSKIKHLRSRGFMIEMVKKGKGINYRLIGIRKPEPKVKPKVKPKLLELGKLDKMINEVFS